MNRFIITSIFAFVFSLPVAWADVSLAPLFRDGAVLQRGKPVPVWGTARPGEAVTVQFGGQQQQTVTATDGHWMLQLDALQASASPARMTVRGDNEIVVNDILVGEVWFCSGQSNMNWTVKEAKDAQAEIAAADNPLIRSFGVRNEVEDTPQADSSGAWQPARPEFVAEFSAVAYYFARELQPQIGVPVGIIKATPGGSSIEAWMSPESLRTDPSYPEMLARRKRALAEFPEKKKAYDTALAEWNAKAAAAKAEGRSFSEPRPRVPEGPKSRNAPSGLYNSNVAPFAPYAIRGFLWYQGEANASRHAAYSKQFPAMIEQWRSDFRQGDLPFYFVQLANFNLRNDPSGKQWAFQREAQSAALKLPNTAMVLAIDIGEAEDIHPRNKQEVGRRLSLVARSRVYGEDAEADGEGPRATAFTIEGDAIRVAVNSRHSPLVLHADTVTDIEIAGSDKRFHPASVRLDGESLVVTSPEVPRPVAVRYLWRNNPQPTIFNQDGLPLAPFRNDNWQP